MGSIIEWVGNWIRTTFEETYILSMCKNISNTMFETNTQKSFDCNELKAALESW